MIKEEKTFHWIKVKTNLMYSTEIKLLMRQPDGGWYFSIYIYLIMLSINSKGRLVQKVNDIEIIYDLTTLTQELMFFKIDTVRVAIEMLRNLGFIYNEGEIICISNFDSLVGSETNWAKYKREQRAKNVQKQIGHQLDNVQQESRVKSQDFKKENNRLKKNKIDKISLTDFSDKEDDFFEIQDQELDKLNHVFTRYLIHSNYLTTSDLSLHKFNRLFSEIDEEVKSKDACLTFKNYQVIIQRFITKIKGVAIKHKFAYFNKAFNDSKTEYMIYLYEKIWDNFKRTKFELNYPEIIEKIKKRCEKFHIYDEKTD
ncbi:MAG: phage replisome organizer N-terminal domain-containing protein [Erysipelotrichales bacterium]|nr:phage replisome organizer N-terminal domain-containing protein [Erysipelotrichales bacterium]